MRVDDVVKIVKKVIAPIKNRVFLSISRGILSALDDSQKIQLAQVSLLADEVKDQVEIFNSFGFTSNAPSGTEFIMVAVGGNRDNGVIVASENRNLRKTGLDSGDSCQYNKNGKFVWLNGDDLKILAEKVEIKNSSHELVAVWSEWMKEVIDGKKLTAIGPQKWDAATLAKLNAVKAKLDTFKI